jgi:hypothetical protein
MTLDNDTVEPIAYPLLFLDGEKGYHFTKHSNLISFKRYVSQRLLRPESTMLCGFLEAPDSTYSRGLRVNRFQILSRTAQVHINTYNYIAFVYLISI